MDAQIKRGLLDVCVLAAIKDGDEATLYTILKRLETADMLTVRAAEHGGRLRKYYSIKPKGLERIAEFKDEWNMILSIYRFITREDGNT